jgi:membrane protein YqaA with SNARE-associated domain
LAILDNTGIPMVGGVDALVVLLAIGRPSQAYWGAAAATIGSLIGGLILFLIARKGGEEYLHRYTSRGRGGRLRRWFQEYGLVTVFVPALVPIPLPMKIFVIASGALEVRPLAFLLVLAAARIPRYVMFAWLGTKFGPDTWPYLRDHIWQLVLFSIGLFLVLYLTIRVMHRRIVTKSQITGSD